MEQYIQCGDIAENPLYVKELGIHIYTAEEFCYYIFNNTYLLGEDFIRQEVIDFFRVELHMPELADKIVKFYGSSADMGAVLVLIMREIGYYEENQIQQFQNRLDRMNRQSLLERSKERGDLLLDKGRFECAVQIGRSLNFMVRFCSIWVWPIFAWDMRMRRWNVWKLLMQN